MPLTEEIDKRRKEIRTDSYPMSIGELANLYDEQELELPPEFQRFFRWTIAQKSRWIESLLLGIPTPSVFVAQRKDGVWDAVDGLQRLPTIFEVMGVLRYATAPLRPPDTAKHGRLSQRLVHELGAGHRCTRSVLRVFVIQG